MTHSSARPTNPPPNAQDKKYLPEQGDIQFMPFTCTKIKQVTIAIAKIHSTIQKIRLKIRKNFFISILQHKRQRIAADQLCTLIGNIPQNPPHASKNLYIFATYAIIDTEQNRPPGFVPLCETFGWPSTAPHAKCGALAQLARAPALQAGGQEFESLMLHH